ncbi:lipoprotein insertase outer membrane protein LolB [Thiothrix lacustris]|uniref:Outer-membrane lipoprotein LolB n=1 Tax=Thiothrix lacustris TaxID=525917 RepID=A0ABY9MR45_9GAMM|nr:lipoprotein insertase outer membrane protein LolB [Thiothrix lacustris]WML91114.1 lipoprotein insertase outer membrane protein LolB [Thiothrix lacustris]WMP16989.1 lipoprotein insertase outer membrane protein LolB [Thiothrix lacustris]
MKQRMLIATCCLLTLGGCASQTKAPIPEASAATKPVSAEAAWQQRQVDFAKMSSWRLQGKVGMQFRDQSASFNLSWLQNGNDQYEMNIKNPLTGSIMAYLKGNRSDVTLQANGKTYRDANAERLLQGQLGVSLPLEGMKYWVRGVPSPDSPVQQVKLDALGRPEMLQQAGWVIEYTGWQGNDWKALPDKINLSRAPDNTKVKVIAKDWQTRY